MGLTKHVRVLAALELRALRYRNKEHKQVDQDQVLYDQALDETGTVDTAGITDSDTESMGEQQQQQQQQWDQEASRKEMEEMAGIFDEVLEVHGVAPGRKAEGVTRVLYENCDGMNNNIGGNDKLEKAKEIIDDLEADVVMYNEHRMNLRHKRNKNGMNQMFNGGEAEIRSVAAHNVHEKKCGRTQQGGTSVLLYGPLIEQHDFKASGKDPTGLGRWV